MAPEMLEGEPGNKATDIYALGVTMFRAFTREFPYGNADATSPPRRNRSRDFSALRPDLPSWLAAALARAIAIGPAKRFHDMTEFAFEIEAGPARAPIEIRRPRTLYERPHFSSGKALPLCWRSRSWCRCWCAKLCASMSELMARTPVLCSHRGSDAAPDAMPPRILPNF
jgi:serine/threonine protein kinase